MPFLAVWLLCVIGPGKAQAASVEIDKVLAAVNGKVITESDLRLAGSLNALLMYGQKDPAGEPTAEEQLSRLIDLELIRQELQTFPPESVELNLIDSREEKLKAGYTEIGGLDSMMQKLGIRSDELKSYLGLQISIMRFVNLRFRPFVSVAPEEVQSYYRDKLVPRLKQANSPIPAIERVAADIENVLKEEKVNAALEAWIKEIRNNSRVEFFGKAQRTLIPGAEEGEKSR